MRRLLAPAFLKGSGMEAAINAYLVKTGSNLVLIDTGGSTLFGPSLGHIADNLRAAGHCYADRSVRMGKHHLSVSSANKPQSMSHLAHIESSIG